MNIVLDLTEREQEIFDEVMKRIDETAAFLAGLSHMEMTAYSASSALIFSCIASRRSVSFLI